MVCVLVRWCLSVAVGLVCAQATTEGGYTEEYPANRGGQVKKEKPPMTPKLLCRDTTDQRHQQPGERRAASERGPQIRANRYKPSDSRRYGDGGKRQPIG